MKSIVGVRFHSVGKVYHFDASGIDDLLPGDLVVVETSRGTQIGQVLSFIEDPAKGSMKRIDRKANPSDLLSRQLLEQKEAEILVYCREQAVELGYRAVKFVATEYAFDGDRAVVLYNGEGDEDVDLSKLLQRLQKAYSGVKFEMRRVGPRDVAKTLGGMGACGLESRCCSKFLTDFSPISIKMAKAQGVSLDPSEITGMCGRLRCCLIYEYEQYVEARKTLPKLRKRVITPRGTGKVIDLLPLTQSVVVYLEEEGGGRAEFFAHELEPWDEHEALRRKAEQPCQNGECNCAQNSKNETDLQPPSEEEPL